MIEGTADAVGDRAHNGAPLLAGGIEGEGGRTCAPPDREYSRTTKRVVRWRIIKSWANSATRRFAEEGKSKFAGLDVEKAEDLLAALNAAAAPLT